MNGCAALPPTPFFAVRVTISFPRVYSTSTVTGAEYPAVEPDGNG